MELPALFTSHPKFKIISTPTPVQRFHGVEQWLKLNSLYIKREDLTDSVYGGNKVRNLEYILGDALAKNSERMVTVAPLGSNFIAALAAQAGKIGLPVEVFHFVPAHSPLITAQTKFSELRGARLHIHSGGKYRSAVKAWIQSYVRHSRKTYRIAPGGSSATGVLGHVGAMFELSRQINQRQIPRPDWIVVGAGTCGTMAGLLAGIKLLGLKTRVVGVRCVDSIVCNRYQIVRLANAALDLLRVSARITMADVDLRDNGHVQYGVARDNEHALISQVRSLSGVELDTTYTAKVFAFLRAQAAAGFFRDQKVLYWNTFSPAALSGDLQETLDHHC